MPSAFPSTLGLGPSIAYIRDGTIPDDSATPEGFLVPSRTPCQCRIAAPCMTELSS